MTGGEERNRTCRANEWRHANRQDKTWPVSTAEWRKNPRWVVLWWNEEDGRMRWTSRMSEKQGHLEKKAFYIPEHR